MEALVYGDGQLSFEADAPDPQRPPGDALIRITVVGICNTDIEIMRGYMNFAGIPGHEFVGVVEAADNEALVGKRVVGEINCPCGDCRMCAMDLGRHCPSRTVMGIANRDGAFAQYTTLPEANLHVLPDDLSDDVAVFTEPAAAAMSILEQLTPQPSDRCLVMGDGKLGLLVAQALSPYCHLTLLGRNPSKLKLARELGIAVAVAGKFQGTGFDVVVDATGNRAGFKGALDHVRPRGKVVLKTTVPNEIPIHVSQLVINEITLVGSRCGLYGPAIEALCDGSIKVEALISERYELADFEAAFARSQESDIIKVLLYPNGMP